MDNTQFPIQKMEVAARNVDKSLAIDCAAPTLLDLMNIHPPQTATASGLTDHDYPVLSGAPHALNSMIQIKTANKVPLPPEILEHFNHIQCHCMMGLFPEIKRAWLTVDSDFYVWSYEDNTDLAYFDGLNETILSVGLVKPKPGVFHAFIKHLLVLTTAVDIVVLGVTFTAGLNGPFDEIQLIPDPVFTVPTDGSTITAIMGTSLGRLFLGSKEGCLFEIVYQAESGWFGKRCKKINHSTSALSFLVPSFLNALSEEDGIVQIAVDNSRHVLYLLTEKGSIEAYDLGIKGDSFSRVTKIAQSTLVNQAVNIVKTLDSQNFRPIVSISAVEASESHQIYLVAVTQTGVRFYLTTHTLVNVPPNQRPYTLYLLHVRLPPGYSANITIRPRAVHIAHHSDRNLLLLSTVNEKDVLWCVSSDLFPFSQNLMEAYTTISLDGPALALAEVRQESPLAAITQEGIPLVVRQHSEPPKKYVVLTSQGVYIFSKMRPVDILRQLLDESQGLDNDNVKAFFMIQKEDQACATSLIIASLDVDENLELAEYATRVFFLYGGEPRLGALGTMSQTNLFTGASPFSPNVVSTPAPHHFQQPPQPSSFTYHPPFDANNPFVFSAKHNGLYLYFGRILRPIWNRKCIEKLCLDGKNIVNASTITSDHCRWILNYLTTLHNFLLTNTQLAVCENSSQHLDTTLNISKFNATNRLNHTIQDAQVEERLSLNSLKLFVCHCCQVMGLWRILCEHQFHVLIGSLPANHQTILQDTTFKDLFLYGQDICSLLITTLVDSYLGDNASVDSISTKLREVCPHLYKIEDAAFSKANEMLKSSRNIQNVDEKEEMVMNALELCKSIAPNINLPGICKQFVTLKAYHAVIDLCITCAKKVDPDNIAQHFYKNDSSVADQEGRDFYHKRLNIYKEVFNMLDTLCTENTPNLSISSGMPLESDARLLVNQLISDILEYPDEILHVALYDWMMKKQLSSELIKVNNTSLETYLLHTSQQNPENVAVVDLLWKYYENNNNHAAAAKILDSLASKTGNSLNLKERLEYLTRAIMCMRSDKVGYAPYLGVFLRDLEDKMEVAKVQEQILDAVIGLRESHPAAEDAIRALNSGLYQISQLYENFADPLELWECQLAIIDCAGYTDENLIEKIWRNILRREIRKSTGNPNNRMAQILAKVKHVARQSGTSTQCFPIAFLVSELEQLSTYLKADRSFVPKAFVAMEFPLESLLEIYNRLISSISEIQIWQKEENEFHLFEAVAALIETFLNSHEAYNSVQKRKIISQCQDTVASLLSILYSKANTEELINMLRGIQSKLSRL
ncbi:nuclear pore complex protein Nup154 [Tribolium castaneum]|uniref:Nuclear pore complex protein Nup155-like Protein n=1 Tax=Tribolium castaneum TaxID=7070 RepID=D6WBT9_TRICA|nr:PREDICTED: nuclear pore complex protein Nup155 isoform X1 [Tribolium castaneum]EEZ97868.2 Nuclear pore complex protein Nup155-like Protein [Tribolium castaneum]|eukprot:XP_008190354.1 PREDICTED: nuclear pore complex protein Nup155 isoform X1 [Tribolium castaneum]